MRWGVIVFPGSCDDYDVYYCLNDVLRQKVEFVWHKDKLKGSWDCLVLPGGFFLWRLFAPRGHGPFLTCYARGH